MPGLDGFHLLKILTSSPVIRPIQIIAATGLTDPEIKPQGGLPERVTVFHKPIQIYLLVTMVRVHFDGWSQQRRAPI